MLIYLYLCFYLYLYLITCLVTSILFQFTEAFLILPENLDDVDRNLSIDSLTTKDIASVLYVPKYI